MSTCVLSDFLELLHSIEDLVIINKIGFLEDAKIVIVLPADAPSCHENIVHKIKTEHFLEQKSRTLKNIMFLHRWEDLS